MCQRLVHFCGQGTHFFLKKKKKKKLCPSLNKALLNLYIDTAPTYPKCLLWNNGKTSTKMDHPTRHAALSSKAKSSNFPIKLNMRNYTSPYICIQISKETAKCDFFREKCCSWEAAQQICSCWKTEDSFNDKPILSDCQLRTQGCPTIVVLSFL